MVVASRHAVIEKARAMPLRSSGIRAVVAPPQIQAGGEQTTAKNNRNARKHYRDYYYSVANCAWRGGIAKDGDIDSATHSRH
jgi:hypothetical protein